MFIKILFNYRGERTHGERTQGECVVRANGPDTINLLAQAQAPGFITNH